MAKTKKFLIWGNIDLNLEDWIDDIKEFYPELAEESEFYDIMYECNNSYLDDERGNLNIQLDQPIIVIANLGLWNGRKSGYKVINSGNIRDCLYSDTDYVEWFVDRLGDMRATATHHDGTNYYLYRVFKENISEEQMENFKEKIYEGICTRTDINRYTQRLGDYIADVYGWDIPRKKHRTRELSAI